MVMVAKTARTIDGMRARNIDTSGRAVGFGGSGKTQSAKIRSTQIGGTRSASRAATKRRVGTTGKAGADFGLRQNDLAKKKAKLKANQDFLKPVSTLEFDLSSKELKPDYSLKKRDLSENPKKFGKKANKAIPKKHKKLKRVLMIIAAILLIGGIIFAIWGNAIIAKLTGGNSGLFDLIGALTSHVDLKTDKNGRTNILIFGTSGFDMEGTEIDGETHDGAQLTDSIMLMSLDQKTGDVAMVSLPRDLYVGNTCTSTGKINEVYYCANSDGKDEEAGAKALESTLSEIFDIDIQYWVHVNWGALMKVVDSVGGITVTLDEDIEDDWTGTYIKAGEPKDLDGWHAVALSRARHGTEMGDFSRANSQQKILSGLQNKMLSGSVDLGGMLGIVDAVGDNVRSNFSLDEIKAVYYIAKDISLDKVRQIPLIDYKNDISYLTNANMNGISYVVPTAGVKVYTDIQNYVHRMISSDPVVRENAVILVLNGSNTTGAASSEQAKLTTDGLSNIETGNAPAGSYPDKYYLYDMSGAKPGTIEALAKRYNVEAQPKEALPAGINTDNADIVIIIGNGTTQKTSQQ